MKVLLAGSIPQGLPAPLAAVRATQFYRFMFSYPYIRDQLKATHPLLNEHPCDVVVDSGAYTIHHTGGLKVTPYAFADFIDQFRETWGARCRTVRFVSLDVIDDQVATHKNYLALSELTDGEVLPVITLRDATQSQVEAVLETEKYFSVGGLRGNKNAKLLFLGDQLQRWITEWRDRTGKPYPRIHFLGTTQTWFHDRYCAYTCDSRSWLSPIIFGQTDIYGITGRTLKGFTQRRDAAKHHHQLAQGMLTAYLQKMNELENTATTIWKGRGIEWHE